MSAKEEFEKEFIIRNLSLFRGNVKVTALHMNVSYILLCGLIKKYYINVLDYM